MYVDEYNKGLDKATSKRSSGAKFQGAKSISWTIFWVSFTVCIINIAFIIITLLGAKKWDNVNISVGGAEVDFEIPNWKYWVVQIVISGISLFLLSGLSLLVFPLNKTLKKESARTFGTWFWGLIVWIFSVFYVLMFFLNLVMPIIRVLYSVKVISSNPFSKKLINILNTVMGCIPIVTIVAAGILYGRVKKTYRKRHGQ